MKINLTKEERSKIEKLLVTDENNRIVSDFYYEVLMNAVDISAGYLDNVSFFDNLVSYFEISDEYIELFDRYQVTNNFKELDIEKYKSNPYYKKIKLANIKDGNYKFENLTYKAYEPILYTNNYLDKGIEITPIGYFKKDFKYLALTENNSIWMLITPHEINTMQKSIDEAKGNVAVFGLGLGYYAYMISNKKEVSSVTIIEKDKKIIDLFNKHILPLFENKQKIKIIYDDAFNYIKKSSFNFNYCFVDLWRDEDDGLPIYINMLKEAKAHKNTYFAYWIESSMLMMIRRCLLTYIQESLDKNQYQYDKEENYYDHIINLFAKELKDYEVNSQEDILYLLNISNIKKLVVNKF